MGIPHFRKHPYFWQCSALITPSAACAASARCPTPCTLWPSCRSTNTSMRRAMPSTTSRRKWHQSWEILGKLMKAASRGFSKKNKFPKCDREVSCWWRKGETELDVNWRYFASASRIPPSQWTRTHRISHVRVAWRKLVGQKYTIWLFNIAMENGPFIDDFPIKNLHLWGIFHGYVKLPEGNIIKPHVQPCGPTRSQGIRHGEVWGLHQTRRSELAARL